MEQYKDYTMEELMEHYRHVSPNELRIDLLAVKELQVLRINDVPDSVVRLFHFLVLTGMMEDAPEWYKIVATFAVNMQRNGEIDHQYQLDELRSQLASQDSDYAQEIIQFYENAI